MWIKLCLILLLLIATAFTVLALIYTIQSVNPNAPTTYILMMGMAIQSEMQIIGVFLTSIGLLIKSVIDDGGKNDKEVQRADA